MSAEYINMGTRGFYLSVIKKTCFFDFAVITGILAQTVTAELLTDSFECVVVNPHYCSVLRNALN